MRRRRRHQSVPGGASSRGAVPRTTHFGVDQSRRRLDLILGLAVGSISFAPATWGMSLLFSLVVFVWSGMELDRAARRGEPESSRLRTARTISNPLFILAAVPFFGCALVALPIQLFSSLFPTAWR